MVALKAIRLESFIETFDLGLADSNASPRTDPLGEKCPPEEMVKAAGLDGEKLDLLKAPEPWTNDWEPENLRGSLKLQELQLAEG